MSPEKLEKLRNAGVKWLFEVDAKWIMSQVGTPAEIKIKRRLLSPFDTDEDTNEPQEERRQQAEEEHQRAQKHLANLFERYNKECGTAKLSAARSAVMVDGALIIRTKTPGRARYTYTDTRGMECALPPEHFRSSIIAAIPRIN